MELIYTYPVNIRYGVAFLIPPILFFIFLNDISRTIKKPFVAIATSVFIFIFIMSTYHEINIYRSLNSNCSISNCEIIEGHVKNFRSYKGNKKFRSNEFSINGHRFVFTGGTTNTSGSNGYSRIIEKGGVITPESKVKIYYYNGKIIKLYKEKM